MLLKIHNEMILVYFVGIQYISVLTFHFMASNSKNIVCSTWRKFQLFLEISPSLNAYILQFIKQI